MTEYGYGCGGIEKKEKLSRRQKALIKEAIVSLPADERLNQSSIVERFCGRAEDCYSGGAEAMEGFLMRMGIATTGDVKKKVDDYIATHASLAG